MKLLFVTSNRIGDGVLSTGLLDHVLRQHPGARVTIACGPAPAPLFRAVPGLERVVVMRKGRMAAHWRHLWRETAFTWWDLVVDLRASAIAWMVPARRRLVYRPAHNDIHRVRQLGALVGRGDSPPAPRLWLDDEARDGARRRIPGDSPVLAVGPTANWAGKQWPAGRFADAITALTGDGGMLPGARVAVFGAPNERAAAEPVLDSLPADRRIDLVGNADLPTVAACLERCAFYLGNDSGLMHMAAAMGVPTLGLFGPSNDALYAPWGQHAAFVRTDRGFWETIAAPDYDHASTASLMTELPVERVVDGARMLWQRCAK